MVGVKTKKLTSKEWLRTTKALVFRTDPQQYQEVFAYAARNNTTASEVVRTFVEWGLENGNV